MVAVLLKNMIKITFKFFESIGNVLPASNKEAEHRCKPATDLLNVLELQRTLIDGGVRNIVTLGIFKHQCQIRINVLNTLIFIVLHLVPVGNYGLSHLERRAQKFCNVK